MYCPKCDAEKTYIVDTRQSDVGYEVRRRRECPGCGYRFTTYERPAQIGNIKKARG